MGRNLYRRSSSYGRWSADVFGTLMPNLVQMCMRSVCVREPCAWCMYSRVRQQVKRRRFCNSDAQVCTEMLEHSLDGSAALVEAPMPGPYTDVPGRISHLHVF